MMTTAAIRSFNEAANASSEVSKYFLIPEEQNTTIRPEIIIETLPKREKSK